MIIFFLLGWNKEFDNENSMTSKEEKKLSINIWKRQGQVIEIFFVSTDLPKLQNRALNIIHADG